MKPVDFAFTIECRMLGFFLTVFPAPHRPIELLYKAWIRLLWFLPDLTAGRNCLNCGKEECSLAGVGNKAGINENDGCWIP